MMRIILMCVITVVLSGASLAQSKYIDRRGYASFFSSAPLEDIKAENNQVVSIVDTGTGEIVASMLMRSFRFRKSLMEEHFNEKYVESHRYPKATFKGVIRNLSQVDFTKPGSFTLEVEGEISVHGVTRPLRVKADAVVDDASVRAKAVFPLTVRDFGIEVPRLVMNNIAEVVEVTVMFHYQLLNP